MGDFLNGLNNVIEEKSWAGLKRTKGGNRIFDLDEDDGEDIDLSDEEDQAVIGNELKYIRMSMAS